MPESLLALAQSGPEALREEFARLVRESRLDGLEAALETMRERLADPLFDVVAVSLSINDRLGGRNVSQVLDRLAHATRAQLRVQRELRAYQARNVLSARIVAALPLVLLVAIRQINPDYVAVFDSPWGQLLLAGCVASVALGYAAMLWVTRLPVDQRILGGIAAGSGAGWPVWGGRLFRQAPDAAGGGQAPCCTTRTARPAPPARRAGRSGAGALMPWDGLSLGAGGLTLRPDALQLRVLIWPVLFGLGLYLLLTSQPLGRPKPDLAERLRRLDVDERIRAEVIQHDVSPVFASRTLERILRPVVDDAGRLLRSVLDRFGLGGGAALERTLRLARPGVDPLQFFGEKVVAALVGLGLCPLMNALGAEPFGPWPVWLWVAWRRRIPGPGRQLELRLAARGRWR